MSDTIKMENGSIELQITLISFKDDEGLYIVYCPSLDLIGCGKNKTEGFSSFEEVLNSNIELWMEQQILDKYLKSCGWRNRYIKAQYTRRTPNPITSTPKNSVVDGPLHVWPQRKLAVSY